MNRRACALLWSAGAVIAAGHRSPTNEAPAIDARANDRTNVVDAPAPADAVAARDGGSLAPAGAAQVFRGQAEGRGADPPIREFTTRATADAWTGRGAAEITVNADGSVRGRLAMTGLELDVNGHREGTRITATLAQIVSGQSAPATTEPATTNGPPEGVFRGVFDGEITGTTLRGTWEASAAAGVHRRRGTIEASVAAP